jgi:hypothetical protein
LKLTAHGDACTMTGCPVTPPASRSSRSIAFCTKRALCDASPRPTFASTALLCMRKNGSAIAKTIVVRVSDSMSSMSVKPARRAPACVRRIRRPR